MRDTYSSVEDPSNSVSDLAAKIGHISDQIERYQDVDDESRQLELLMRKIAEAPTNSVTDVTMKLMALERYLFIRWDCPRDIPSLVLLHSALTFLKDSCKYGGTLLWLLCIF